MSDKTPGQRLLSDAMQNGGGTYTAADLQPYHPSDGFAVGLGGVELNAEGDEPISADALEAIVRDIAEAYGTTYVGTWLSKGILYVDAVLICWDERSAYYAASNAGQEAVYDFSRGESLRLMQLQWDS